MGGIARGAKTGAICDKKAYIFLAKLCFQKLLAAKLSFHITFASPILPADSWQKAAKLWFQHVAKLWVKLHVQEGSH